MKNKILKKLAAAVVEQSTKDQSIHTLAGFLDLPESEREQSVWFWPTKWYKEPYALELGEWDKFRKYIQANYPVQHFIRDTLYIRWIILRAEYGEAKRWIECRLVHPRKEMIQSVFPPDRQDLDSIIVQFNLECIVEYVDREKCFEHIQWDDSDDRIQQAAMIKEIHEYATSGRMARVKEINLLWAEVPLKNIKLDDYAAIDAKEKEIDTLDTKYCTWIVKNRSLLWT